MDSFIYVAGRDPVLTKFDLQSLLQFPRKLWRERHAPEFGGI